ncbi:hypothetical protein K1719_035573 [Acacia pycnantha]|nr:hypothetical protein K1719_035573 [Acacia pycnantha]
MNFSPFFPVKRCLPSSVIHEMQEMEEDMEIEHVFVAHEIDLDYEFDAARLPDFTRPETPAKAHQVEIWFEIVGSYPLNLRPYRYGVV